MPEFSIELVLFTLGVFGIGGVITLLGEDGSFEWPYGRGPSAFYWSMLLNLFVAFARALNFFAVPLSDLIPGVSERCWRFLFGGCILTSVWIWVLSKAASQGVV